MKRKEELKKREIIGEFRIREIRKSETLKNVSQNSKARAAAAIYNHELANSERGKEDAAKRTRY